MEINYYPDGTSYVNKTKLGEQVFRTNDYKELWQLGQFVDAFHSQYSTKTSRIKPNIIIPNLLDAQADRRFNKGESSNLKLVCNFLNSLEANFKIFHPHNSEVVEALIDNVEIIDNSDFLNTVLKSLSLDFFKNNETDKNFFNETILMSSDAGGFKPLIKTCDKIGWMGETFSASKSRSWDEKEGTKFVQQVDRSDFKGKDILIVDDISVYGGTFKGLSKLLRERNCGKLYLAVSHITVRNLGDDPVTNYFEKVFTTNSKYKNYGIENEDPWSPVLGDQPKNLEIIKLF